MPGERTILHAILEAHGADAVLITCLPDIRWVCGFTGSNGLLIVTGSEAHFVTDGRYATQSQDEVHGASVHIAGGDLFSYLQIEGLLGESRRVLVQGDHLSVADFGRLQALFEGIDWIAESDLFASLVSRKNSDEVDKIKEAQAITDTVFEHLLNFIQAGMSEREVAAEIVYQHLKRGAESMSFDPIVAGGPNGALPHATPTNRKLQHGDLVVIDMGCFSSGYASDMTRTIAIGEPGKEARYVHDVVLEAQRRAVEMASPKLNSRELDAVARSFIEEAGYGEYFTHSLGHGLGLQIHEWPRISWRTEDTLAEGMAITIEPGVYLPGRFGVRIEDIVVLTAEGCDVLTKSPKELAVL